MTLYCDGDAGGAARRQHSCEIREKWFWVVACVNSRHVILYDLERSEARPIRRR
jgi:hypothetical protein